MIYAIYLPDPECGCPTSFVEGDHDPLDYLNEFYQFCFFDRSVYTLPLEDERFDRIMEAELEVHKLLHRMGYTAYGIDDLFAEWLLKEKAFTRVAMEYREFPGEWSRHHE